MLQIQTEDQRNDHSTKEKERTLDQYCLLLSISDGLCTCIDIFNALAYIYLYD